MMGSPAIANTNMSQLILSMVRDGHDHSKRNRRVSSMATKRPPPTTALTSSSGAHGGAPLNQRHKAVTKLKTAIDAVKAGETELPDQITRLARRIMNQV
eukprot:2268292-Pleurochrysis_carterae.AAC.1